MTKSLIDAYIEEQKVLACLEELGAVPNAENLNILQGFLLCVTAAAREEEAWELTTAMECGHVAANRNEHKQCIVCAETATVETLGRACAELVRKWEKTGLSAPTYVDYLVCAKELAALPAVKERLVDDG